ncbi:hypothetical protein T8S45_13590 [Blastomonas marina]|uniref:hypothetical protein n=1 Tax=Blastomonas marina TaxID=1867408 RepID=UPI002AC9A857|nr:hypothetical protein [Blastomonas marina]WPZ03843.1 hypothetical protein T8S45_13590 [Blastomonas marina]
MRIMAMTALATMLAGCATTGSYGSAETLGSETNPVRVQGPKGERAYLDRLRCADGSAPAYERRGSGSARGDGHIVDFYDVTCPGAEPVTIIMDMYHSGSEARPVPGFTIVN